MQVRRLLLKFLSRVMMLLLPVVTLVGQGVHVQFACRRADAVSVIITFAFSFDRVFLIEHGVCQSGNDCICQSPWLGPLCDQGEN